MENNIRTTKTIELIVYREKRVRFSLLFLIALSVFYVFDGRATNFPDSFESILHAAFNGQFSSIPDPYIEPKSAVESRKNTAILIGYTLKSITIGTETAVSEALVLARRQIKSEYSTSYDFVVAHTCGSFLKILQSNYLSGVYDAYQSYSILKSIELSVEEPEMFALANTMNLFFAKMPPSLGSLLKWTGFTPLSIPMVDKEQSNEFSESIYVFNDALLRKIESRSIGISNNLITIIRGNFYLKNKKPEVALDLLNTIDTSRINLPIMYYFKGIAHMYLGDFKRANYYYSKFLLLQPQGNFVKSALIRKKWMLILENEPNTYLNTIIAQKGNVFMYTDKQAEIEVQTQYNKDLLHVRILFDGGRLTKAQDILQQIDTLALSNRELVEFLYRYGRVLQGLDQNLQALEYYKQVVQKPYVKGYFHKKSTLETGRIYLQMGNYERANIWFSRVADAKTNSYKDVLDEEAEVLLLELVGQ